MKLKNWMNPRTVASALLVAGLTAASGPSIAGNIENMERERAILIDTILNVELTPGEREARMEISQRRLVDLERLVLRDDGLIGRNTPVIRRAFGNYDLTFLVHAAAETGMSIMDTWLEQMGLTSQALMVADRKRR